MACELRRYWPRKSDSSPRISVNAAVARQCAPNACEYSSLAHSPCTVLADRRLQRHAAVGVDGVTRAAQKRAGQSAVRREIEERAVLGHHLPGVSADEEPFACLPLQLHHVQSVFVFRFGGGGEVSRLGFQGHCPSTEWPHRRRTCAFAGSSAAISTMDGCGLLKVEQGQVIMTVVERERILRHLADVVPARAELRAARETRPAAR